MTMPSDAEPLVRLIYRSRSTMSQISANATVHSLLDAARIRNEASDLTGVLLFDETAFLQILEGKLRTVERIYEIIACDQRHTELELLDLSPIEERHFGAFSMAALSPAEDRYRSLRPFMVRGGNRRQTNIDDIVAEISGAMAAPA